MSSELSISDLCKESAEVAKSKGFSGQTFPEFVALVHSELSEALEEYRDGKELDEIWYSNNYGDGGIKYKVVCGKGTENAKPEGIPTELADVIIRICHYCGENDIDLQSALIEKISYNKTRSYRHGNKVV